mgnify:CR=1 FL=1|jgi:hypothetical protein
MLCVKFVTQLTQASLQLTKNPCEGESSPMETSGFFLNILRMKLIPTNININLDDAGYFTNINCFWNLFNLPAENLLCNTGLNINLYRNSPKVNSDWTISGFHQPWYEVVEYTEEEKIGVISVKKMFDKEIIYIKSTLKENLIPYENILAPYSRLEITKNGKIVKSMNTNNQLPIIHNIDRSTREHKFATEDVYGVDYSTIFLGPLSSQPLWIESEHFAGLTAEEHVGNKEVI